MKKPKKATTIQAVGLLQFASRTYRYVLAIYKILVAIQRDQSTVKRQADTIARLLRQHDTMKRMPTWPQMERDLILAGAYVAEPPGAGEMPIIPFTDQTLPAYIRDLPPLVLRGIPGGSAAPGPSTAAK